jgi:hypothetical protein
MRPLVIGALLALVAGFTSPAKASVIMENPTFLFPSVPWQFSTATNTFSGEQAGELGSTGLFGRGTLDAIFDDLGHLQSGTFEVRGVSNSGLLLKGTLTSHSPPEDGGPGTHFFTIFFLDVDFTSPLLGFDADFGEWHTFVCKGSDPDCGPDGPTSLAGLFTTDYTDANMPLFNYLRTFTIPSPPPGALLGLGVAILLAMRVRRLI